MTCVVCVCAVVTEDELLAAIRCGASRASALMACTGAGMTCGDCREDLNELIEEAGSLSAGAPASGIAGGEDMTMTAETEAGDAGREELASTEIDWDDIDKASHHAHALLRDVAESALLEELIAAAVRELAHRLVEVDGTERVVLLAPADRDWILELLLGDDAPPPDPAAPSVEYSVLSLRGGFEFTIFHRDSTDDNGLVPSVTRFEQPGSCYTSSATLVQTLGTTSETVALVVRRPTRQPAEGSTEAVPARTTAVLSRLAALGMSR